MQFFFLFTSWARPSKKKVFSIVCCILILVNPVQEAGSPTQFRSAKDESCGAGSVTLSVASTANNVEWYDDPTLLNQVSTGLSYTVSLTASTTFYVIGKNTNGCNTAPVQVVGTISQPSSPSFTYAINGATVDFTETINGSWDSLLWNFGDGQTSTNQNPSNTYTSTGTYSVTS